MTVFHFISVIFDHAQNILEVKNFNQEQNNNNNKEEEVEGRKKERKQKRKRKKDNKIMVGVKPPTRLPYTGPSIDLEVYGWHIRNAKLENGFWGSSCSDIGNLIVNTTNFD